MNDDNILNRRLYFSGASQIAEKTWLKNDKFIGISNCPCTPCIGLHLAVWERRSENVIRTIMEAYPAACLIRNYGTGATPLYLACERSPDEKIIQMLLEACPEAASVRSGGGRVPLHIAVWRGHPFLHAGKY